MKKKLKIELIYISFLTVLFGISVIPLKNRICGEADNSVALAVEYDDVADFFGAEKLADFKTSGINTVVICDDKAKDFLIETENSEYKNYPSEKYLGISSNKISAVSKLNLDMVFSVQGDISLIPKKNPGTLALILSDDFYGETPADFNYTFGLSEFAKQKEVKKILKKSGGGYRVFKVRWESDYKKNLDKIKRAALERNVGIIILDLSQTTLDYALEYIRQSKKSLVETGFDVDKPASIKTINSNFAAYTGITKIISLFIALLSPVICLLFISFNYNFDGKFSLVKSVLIFLLIAVFSLMSGTTIAGLLATKDFMLGIDLFRGVKIVSLTPILILLYLLYGKNLINFLKKPLLYGEAVFIGFLLFAVGFYILRTGNYGSTISLEDNFRLILEKIFFIRPRFKEFLIGHPFMLLAIYLKYKENNFLWKPFFIFGIIGQISIINTFCHIHTPFFVSMMRSFNGILAGLLLGIILIYFYNLIKKYV